MEKRHGGWWKGMRKLGINQLLSISGSKETGIRGALKGRVKNSREEKSNGKSGAGKTRKGKERKARKAAAASLERKRRMEREGARVGLWMKENRKRRGCGEERGEKEREGTKGWDGGGWKKARRVCITLHSTWRHFCVVARYFFLALGSRNPRVATTDPMGGRVSNRVRV